MLDRALVEMLNRALVEMLGGDCDGQLPVGPGGKGWL